ncbi:MAG: replication-relaxation family protein [Anaerolineae bacterium]|nr:replication-relaxation family protein [Anaerolineae bacterium]
MLSKTNGILFEHPPRSVTAPKRLSVFTRSDQPPLMRLTERDKRILEAIHAYDGILADYQIQRLFFTGRTQMQTRTRLLYQHGYLARPDRRHRALLPSMVYWLGERGAAYVAGLDGQSIQEFTYRREPRWQQVEHDLAVNDVRIALTQACVRHPHLLLEEWLPQSEFWAHPDRVEYTDLTGKRLARRVRPDGYCVILSGDRRFRLLWEIDRSTEDNPRFVREKVLPGIAYIRNPAYVARFGHPSGLWLIVTTSERRLRNMKRQTEQAAGDNAHLFYFTTIEQIAADTVLSAPIWRRGGGEAPTTLLAV